MYAQDEEAARVVQAGYFQRVFSKEIVWRGSSGRGADAGLISSSE
jgi:hypothetical protein